AEPDEAHHGASGSQSQKQGCRNGAYPQPHRGGPVVTAVKGKRVLVTGAGGFIGSHLVEALVESGAEVRAFVHYRGNGSWGWLDRSTHKTHFEVGAGDVTDRDSVASAMKSTSIVFHLAALIGIPYSYHAPILYIRTNVEGTLNVLQAGREAGVERVIHTST